MAGDPGAFKRMRYGYSDWVAEPADVGPFVEAVIADLIKLIKPAPKVTKRKRSPDVPDQQEASTPRQPEGQSPLTGASSSRRHPMCQTVSRHRPLAGVQSLPASPSGEHHPTYVPRQLKGSCVQARIAGCRMLVGPRQRGLAHGYNGRRR